MIKVGVVGARGRMGQQVCATVDGEADLELVAQVDEGDSLEALLGSDVVVDFTHPGVVMGNLKWCVEHGLMSPWVLLDSVMSGSLRCGRGRIRPRGFGC